MTIAEFKQSLQGSEPPPGLNVFLEVLWYDGKKEWKKAHDLVDRMPGLSAARIHAYLHRVEGDIGNATYWYYKSRERMPPFHTEDEWDYLVNRFL
jgi:hypothetical protein